MKFRWHAYWMNFSAWYLTPALRFGLYRSEPGGFIGLTLLKFDIAIWWSKS